jgi:thiamine kinase-like enzyme
MNLDRIIAVRNAKTVYRDGDKCIKVFDETYSKADVLHEATNQALVEETGLFIPRVLDVEMIDGKWAIISDFIKGKTMDQLMKEDPSREKEFLDSFVSLQMEVHSKNCLRLASLKEKMKRKISQADLDATTRYDLHTRLEGMPRHERLCHGDFNPSNIIVTEDGRYCILDWAHATIGNASADVARTYLLFWLEGKMELAEAYLNLFCMKSGTSKQYVQKWMPIVAASQSVKGNEKEREFLLGWANVVEYE